MIDILHERIIATVDKNDFTEVIEVTQFMDYTVPDEYRTSVVVLSETKIHFNTKIIDELVKLRRAEMLWENYDFSKWDSD